jgi:hypothetical protein
MYNSELARLRAEYKLPGAEIVAAAQTVCPSFDKAMLSKCERGGKYGIRVDPKIMDAIITICVPDHAEELKRRVRGGNYLSKRVQCRLEDATFAELQQRQKADGYGSMQDLLSDLIMAYLVERSGT